MDNVRFRGNKLGTRIYKIIVKYRNSWVWTFNLTFLPAFNREQLSRYYWLYSDKGGHSVGAISFYFAPIWRRISLLLPPSSRKFNRDGLWSFCLAKRWSTLLTIVVNRRDDFTTLIFYYIKTVKVSNCFARVESQIGYSSILQTKFMYWKERKI